MQAKDNPAIGVIIPLYNKGLFVKRAIRSVLAQTFQDFEIIVVNDGSTDNGPAVVESNADLRIRLIHQANAGVSAARNRGIAESRADLIAFLDADDEWRKTFLETIVRLRDKFPQCGVFATNYEFCYEDGRRRNPIIRGVPPLPWEGILSEYFAVAARGDGPLWTSAIAVRKDAIEAVGGFPVGIAAGEDLLTWARLAAHAPIGYSSKSLSVFHYGTPAGLHRLPERKDKVGEQLQKLATTRARGMPGIRRYMSLWYKMQASCFLRAGNRWLAAKACVRSLCNAPFNWKMYVYLAMTVLPMRLVQWLFKVGMQK